MAVVVIIDTCVEKPNTASVVLAVLTKQVTIRVIHLIHAVLPGGFPFPQLNLM